MKLLEHLADGLDLMPERLDANEMRQTEQLVEALRQAEMGEALTQIPPATVLFRLLRRGGQQRGQIELDVKRNIDGDLR